MVKYKSFKKTLGQIFFACWGWFSTSQSKCSLTRNLLFKPYSGNLIKQKGKVNVNVKYNVKSMQGELHIFSSGFDALLGRKWIRELNIELKQVFDQMKASSLISTVHYSKPLDEI